MAIITLTTDFGTKDYFAAALKGAILKEYTDAKIIDISHRVSAYDIEEAAYLLSNAYPSFPKSTIHIIGVNATIMPEERFLVVEARNQFFIGADNGIFSILFHNIRVDSIHEIEIPNIEDKPLFPEHDLFVRAAAHLARGGKPGLLGRAITNYHVVGTERPYLLDQTLHGRFIYIDRFGNAVTNITRGIFEEARKDRDFSIVVKHIGQIEIKKITRVYIENKTTAAAGKEIALFNSAGHLEIAMLFSDPDTRGGAASLLGLKKNMKLTIEFE
jgi:S-adenosylmethionine hydrolase